MKDSFAQPIQTPYTSERVASAERHTRRRTDRALVRRFRTWARELRIAMHPFAMHPNADGQASRSHKAVHPRPNSSSLPMAGELATPDVVAAPVWRRRATTPRLRSACRSASCLGRAPTPQACAFPIAGHQE